MNILDDRDATPLPKLPKIASDIPLEWDSTLRDLESFIVKLKRSPLSTTDKYANEFQRKYDDVRHRFEVYGSVSGLKHRWSDQDFDEMQQWVEAWLCREMYHIIFPHSAHGINKQDFLQDEQLQAKIAALNFLDLTLEHLGFVLEHPEDVEHIAQVVREGGVEMQKLATVKSPSDKMNVILSSHRVVVDALNREPAVQDLLVEVEETNDASSSNVENEGSIDKADVTPMTARRRSKRLSIPKILMDGNIPEPATLSPKIPMDEGYDRPSQAATEADRQVADAAKPVTAEEKPAMGSGEKETEGEDQKVVDSKDDIEKNATAMSERLDKKESDTTQVNPANVELPKSPEPESGTALSPAILETAAPPTTAETTTTATASTASAANAATSSTTSRKQYSADVLLPLLIFSVVKSNPPMLISNLRYIQRFKVQDQLNGELAYCLTNMMAVVSFLETLDPKALGLSSDIRVLSDVSDIQVTAGKSNHPPTPLMNFQEGIDHTKALGHKVSQEIVGVAEEGIKVISDVVQDGYSKFFGRLLTTADAGLTFVSNQNKQNRGTRAMSAASSLAATAAANAAAEEERKKAIVKEEVGGHDKGLAGLVSPAGVTSDVTTLSVDGTAVATEKSSLHDSAMEHAAKNRVLEYVRSSEGPQFQFMACTDSGDLRLSDVKSLLEDYQRIGKILEEMKRLA
ncbi:hypothetical protein EDD21DRAFT_191442 [Dissophora ornata]|nr:hypothetical protein EDD21DRAFT_191442 [Dissophora ornata]